MLIQSQPNRHLRSRRISGVRSLTDLTALAIFRLSVSPIQGITAHSASSGQGETRLLSHAGVVMPRQEGLRRDVYGHGPTARLVQTITNKEVRDV
jgi:hypothetical protein